ncbi:MAG: glycosyltransferase [Chitinophagaceae bacterium]
MGSKKKLVIVSTHPVQYNAPLFKLLAERGNIEITVIYSWGPAVKDPVYDPGFEKIIQWDLPLLEGYKYIFPENTAKQKGSHHFNGIDNPGIITIIKDCAPDAILVYGWSFKSHLKLLRYFSNKKMILFRGDSTLLDDKAGGFRAVIRKYFLTWVYRYIHYALYTGKNNYNYFTEAGLRNAQLLYAPHAVDNGRFYKNSESEAQALEYRRTLNIGAGELVFLFAGKFESKKDPLLLLSAFMEQDLYKNAQLVFVGNGRLENELKQMAAGVPSIHFMDFQNQTRMPGVYQMADVFVLPSKGPGETWGLAINESMAAGCAVIASDKCGGAIDLVENGSNGFIFKSGNRKELTDSMQAMAGNPGRLVAMKAASIEKIAAFSFTAVATTIEIIVARAGTI